MIIYGQVEPARQVLLTAADESNRGFESLGKPFPVRDGALKVRRRERDVIFPDRRFDLDGPLARALADDLLVPAALLRDVDQHIPEDFALAR